MSEPRKLNTGSAQHVYHAGDAQARAARAAAGSAMDQQAYEEARRAAQRAAAGAGRQRRTQSFPRVQQSAAPPAPETPPAAPPAQTNAQRQAAQLRQAGQARTIRRSGASVQRLDLSKAQGKKPMYNMEDDPDYAARRQRQAARAAQPAAGEPVAQARRAQPAPAGGGSVHRAAAGQGRRANGGGHGGGNPPPRNPSGKQGKGGGKRKRRGTWWKVLLGTLVAVVLIFGGTLAIIRHAIAPAAGAIGLDEMINTPKEYQGKELNLLVAGIDRSSTDDLSAGAANDSGVNDGMTDMLLYVHFNNETGELKMLQIPRDTMASTDRSVTSNYRINAVAKTQGENGNNNMAALCKLVSDQYQIPIDGYVTIRLEMLVELVDYFGGIELNVPFDIDYTNVSGGGSSKLSAGYQTVNGAACEFLLRARKIYPDGDITRLNVQRQFYSALFRRLKDMNNIWDVARLVPVVLGRMETDISVSQLVSFAISVLKMDSSKIMICQMPVIMGAPYYNDQAVVYAARQASADLLNTYFRENTGYVDASELQVCDTGLGFSLDGYAATDPNIQVMGDIMAEDVKAQQENNLDGSNQVGYDVSTESGAAVQDPGDGDAGDAATEPAA